MIQPMMPKMIGKPMMTNMPTRLMMPIANTMPARCGSVSRRRRR